MQRSRSLRASIAVLVASSASTLAQAQCPSFVAGSAGTTYTVTRLESFDDGLGGGPRPYALDSHGSILRFDGVTWSALPGAPANVSAIAAGSVAGAPARLYAAGDGIAAWDGAGWTSLSTTIGSAQVGAMEVLDLGSGGALYLSGSVVLPGFPNDPDVGGFAFLWWDGGAWHGTGSTDWLFSALAVHDDGGGARIYGGAVGAGPQVGCFVRSTGTMSFERVGPIPLIGTVFALVEHDDGSGLALHVGGNMTSPAGRNLVRWDGASVSQVGTDVDGGVSALASLDDGTSRTLVVAGAFLHVGSIPANRIARWNGAAWSAFGSGLTNSPYALLASSDRASGAPELVVGGAIASANGLPVTNVAFWRGCSFATACAGDGSDPQLVACPCGNVGGAGHGCGSSLHAGGALLAASGAPVVASDTLTLTASDLTGPTALFFQGDAIDASGVVFGDGVRCVGGNVRRLRTAGVGGGSAAIGLASGSSLASSGLVPPEGGMRVYQAWYRNAASFCTSDTFNATNGVRVLWVP